MTTRLSDSDLRDVEHALRLDVPPTLEQAKLMLAEVRASRSSTSGPPLPPTTEDIRRALPPVESPGEEGAQPTCRDCPHFLDADDHMCTLLGRPTLASTPACQGIAAPFDAKVSPAPAAAESTRADLAEIERLMARAIESAVDAALGEVCRQAGDFNPPLMKEARNTGIFGGETFARKAVTAIRSLAAPREVEEARAALATIVSNEGGCGTQSDMITTTCRERFPGKPGCWCGFCVASAALSSPSGEAPERGDGLAPWYEADGSTVMLPAEEVERRRRLAAKVLALVRRFVREDEDAPGELRWGHHIAEDGTDLGIDPDMFAAEVDDLLREMGCARPSTREHPERGDGEGRS